MTKAKPSESNRTQSQRPKVQKQMNELEVLVRARYPLMYIISWEEQRVLSLVNTIASQLNKKVFEWSVTTGLVPGGTSIQSQKHRDTASRDPLVALDEVIEHMEPALYVFKDFHPFLSQQNIAVIRRLREIAASLKHTYKTIIIVSPIFEIPSDLIKDLTVIDFDLPQEKDFAMLLDRIIEEVRDNPKLNVNITADAREQIVHALLGLTLAEAENVLAKTLVQHRGLGQKGVEVILGEKKQIIRKSGVLEYYEAQENMESIGGLDALKAWLTKRSIAFTDRARQFGLPAPRGVLLLGVQGCGKSLMAKAVSKLWHLPLLRFDVGRVFGSLVGSSEENIRRAIKVAQSVSPAVLWVDEIDKAFRGSRGSSGGTDAGVAARVFGTFLTWMSEKTEPVFVVATANDVASLPPELLRKGRFDEIFFVDLPVAQERKDIFHVHLVGRRRNPDDFDLEKLAAASAGFSGAEIEESIISGLFDVFAEQRNLSTEDLLVSLKQTFPLSKTMSEDVDRLRQWAEGRTRSAASEEVIAAGNAEEGRKLEL